jgi:hypothetical protein
MKELRKWKYSKSVENKKAEPKAEDKAFKIDKEINLLRMKRKMLDQNRESWRRNR